MNNSILKILKPIVRFDKVISADNGTPWVDIILGDILVNIVVRSDKIHVSVERKLDEDDYQLLRLSVFVQRPLVKNVLKSLRKYKHTERMFK